MKQSELWVKERVAAAAAGLRLRAESAIQRVEQVREDLFDGRHSEPAAVLVEEVAKARKAFETNRHREVPGIVFRALKGAEAAVYITESAELAETIEELSAWPALHSLKQAAENRLQRSYGLSGDGSWPDFRAAVRLLREAQAIVERGLSNPTATPSKGSGRTNRDADWRARKLQTSVGPKGPSGQSGPQHGSKKGGNGKKK